MSEHPRRDRDWEHWPGRKTDERIRHKLKALFAPSDAETEVADLVTQRGREIEERTEQLQATIVDLERREEQTGRLRSAVEEMLKHGSAELDERHAALAALAVELGAREERTRAGERELAIRTQELGAVELRKAAVVRREEAATERESALAQIAAELADRETQAADAEWHMSDLDAEISSRQRALAASQQSILERERLLAEQEAELARLASDLVQLEQRIAAEQAHAETVAGAAGGLRAPRGETVIEHEARHILYLTADGYELVAREGRAPEVGAHIVLDGRAFVVARLGRSPLPGDSRVCAYLESARHG